MSSDITGDRLTSLFRPRSVALVGVSDKSAFSMIAYQNLVRFGFADRTYLVNRRGAATHGRPTVTSCTQIGEPVDVAYLMVPQAGTLAALDDAAAAGIRNACVLSSGYGEAGEAGRAAQAELAAHARSLDMVLLGPNHLGFANFVDGYRSARSRACRRSQDRWRCCRRAAPVPRPCSDFAAMVNVGLSYLVTLGNEAMITAGHVLDFLVDDPATRAVAIFMETVRDPGVFRRAARRAAEAGKAIVALKAGSSALSARTAAAHTARSTGDDRVIEAVLRRPRRHPGRLDRGHADHGRCRGARPPGAARHRHRVDLRRRLRHRGRPGRRSRRGAARAGRPDRQALGQIMPAYGTVQNPLDVTGAAIIDPSIFTRAIEAMSALTRRSASSAGQLGALDRRRPLSGQMFVDAIGSGVQAARRPVAYINQVMQPVTETPARSWNAAGALRHPRPAPGGGRAAQPRLVVRAPGARDLVPAPPAITVRRLASGAGSGRRRPPDQLLSAAGVPVVPAGCILGRGGGQGRPPDYGGPVALKVVSPQILHKSDIGGVRLNVPGRRAGIRDAYAAVTAAAAAVDGADVEGVLGQPMRSGGTELLGGGGPRSAAGAWSSRWPGRGLRRGAGGLRRSRRCP